MKRRMVSLTLALCLCLSLMPAAWAAEAPPASYTTPSGLTIHVTRPVGTLDDTSLTYMGDGVFQVREENGTYGLYDINGARLGQLGDVFLLGNFEDGLCPVRVYDVYTAENKCGYIDRTGQLAIAAQYQEVKDFSEGYAAVKNENGWGYIDTSGNLVVPCQYQMAYPFQDGEAVVEYHTQVQTFQYTRHKYIDTANRPSGSFPLTWRMLRWDWGPYPCRWTTVHPRLGAYLWRVRCWSWRPEAPNMASWTGAIISSFSPA